MALEPRTGDVVTLGNARWAVVSAEGARMELLRLNEAAPEPAPEPAQRPDNVLTVEQAAEELGMHPKTVREYLATGQLAGRKVGTKWRILRSENPLLQRYLERKQNYAERG